MTAQRKEMFLNILWSSIASVILMCITLYASGIVTEKQDTQLKIEKKADKVELEKHEAWDDKRFDEIRKQNDQTVGEIKEDIRWLREEVVDALKQNKK